MLLRGAYSAKYRAVQQEQVENYRDEEREEFNVKFEKTKELSRDTNRRRRALEQRRKDYEAEEERKRREILAQRRKEIQEATEKFQRANAVRSKRKPNHNNNNLDQKSYQKVKQSAVPTGFVTKPNVSQVNGKPYYPSVEEVLAMLHADRAEVMERLVSGESEQPMEHHHTVQTEEGASPHATILYPGPRAIDPHNEDVTSEQRLQDQERLRSEVVGRAPPKLAFEDHSEYITEGVLPTTIRRDSPSGSLSSLDSLDEVRDEMPKPEFSDKLAGCTVVGIIRKPDKVKSDSRVTFNENVVFNDGLVGALKKEELYVMPGVSSLDKQQSYFEMPSKNSVERGKSETVVSETKYDTPLPSAPKLGPTSTGLKYPYVTVTHLKTGEDSSSSPATNYSKSEYSEAVSNYNGTVPTYSNGSTSYSGVVPFFSDSSTRYSEAVPTYSGGGTVYSSAATSYSGAVPSHASIIRSRGTTATVNGVRNTPTTSSSVSQDLGSHVHQSAINKPRSSRNEGAKGAELYSTTIEDRLSQEHKNTPRNGFHVDSQGRSTVGETTSEGSNPRGPFSSINVLKLRDSLEISHESVASHESKPDFSTATSVATTQASQHTRVAHGADVLPGKPLVPVTKKDFLSKVLSRTNDHKVTSPDDLNSRNGISNDRPTSKGIPSNVNYTRNYATGRGHVAETNRQNEHRKDTNTRCEYGARNDTRGYIGTNGITEPITGDTTKRTGYYGDKQGQSNRGTLTYNGIDRSNKSRVVVDSRKRERVSTTNGEEDTLLHERNVSEDLLKTVQSDLEKISMVQPQQTTSRAHSPVAPKDTGSPQNARNQRSLSVSNRTRKGHVRKKSANGPKSKEGKRTNSTTRRLHKPAGDPGSGTRSPSNGGTRNVQYNSTQTTSQGFPVSNTNLASVQNNSSSTLNNNRRPVADVTGPDCESRPIESCSQREPPWANTFERKQRKNIDGIPYLDKTPTDEEINKLWETVRTCLKHEQSRKAASDSIVNTVRHSRSESGPAGGNHYLIDNQRWVGKPRQVMNAFGPGSQVSEPRLGGYTSFRRQNSLDGFQRRGSSESSVSLPQRKAALLEHRSSRSERKLTRSQHGSKPPLNPHYIQTLRGPAASMRGPQKSNTVKADEPKRPQLSYAEFQAVMQASADAQTRNGEVDTTQRMPQQTSHQPIIMDARKEPSALSLEEKRLLESLDRLNERLKVQEAVTGKLITKGQRSPNVPGSVSNMGSKSKLPQTSPNNGRFTTRSRHKDLTPSPSLLNRR